MTNTFNGFTYSGDEVIISCGGKIVTNNELVTLEDFNFVGYYNEVYNEELTSSPPLYTDIRMCKAGKYDFILSRNNVSVAGTNYIQIDWYNYGVGSNCVGLTDKYTITIPSVYNSTNDRRWDVISHSKDVVKLVQMDTSYLSGVTITKTGTVLSSGLTFTYNISALGGGTNGSGRGLRIYDFNNGDIQFNCSTAYTGTTSLVTFGKIINWGASPTTTFYVTPYSNSINTQINRNFSSIGVGNNIIVPVPIAYSSNIAFQWKLCYFDGTNYTLTSTSLTGDVSFPNIRIPNLLPVSNNKVFGYFTRTDASDSNPQLWELQWSGGTNFSIKELYVNTPYDGGSNSNAFGGNKVHTRNGTLIPVRVISDGKMEETYFTNNGNRSNLDVKGYTGMTYVINETSTFNPKNFDYQNQDSIIYDNNYYCTVWNANNTDMFKIFCFIDNTNT